MELQRFVHYLTSYKPKKCYYTLLTYSAVNPPVANKLANIANRCFFVLNFDKMDSW